MEELKVFDPKDSFIVIGDEYAPVAGFAEDAFKDGKLKKDTAYVHDNHCYIYGGKLKGIAEPGYFYKNKERDELLYVPARNFEASHTSNIKTVKRIKNELINKKDVLKEREEKVDLTDIRVFAPPINDYDDPLKKLIKQVLAELQIDMREYSYKFKNEYDITNLKGSITKDNPLSIKYFLRWCEILELGVCITLDSPNDESKHKRLAEPISTTIS